MGRSELQCGDEWKGQGLADRKDGREGLGACGSYEVLKEEG